MIGVVVWSNAEREKAVIWCDDHGALAYLHGSQNLADKTTWPLAGDLVELSSETLGDLRYARDVALVDREYYVELPTILKQEDSAAQSPALRLMTSEGQRVERQQREDARISHDLRFRRLAV